MFVDRDRELERLEEAWRSERAEMIVVYGRRRIGKTSLLRQFLLDRPHMYWVATLTSEQQLRRAFSESLWQSAHPGDAQSGPVFDSWDGALAATADLARTERYGVVIDEYPYLASSVPGVSSVLQKAWDERLRQTRLMLVLCGSSIGVMEREALSYEAPLYGRRTGQLRLGPLGLRAAASFCPRYSTADKVATYAVVGGIPAYLQRIDDRRALVANIEGLILDPSGYLHPEPEFLLREELREPRNYFGILQAIAGGRTHLNEIAQAVGMERTAAVRYLATLRDLQLVERCVPVTERQPEKSRRGLYRLCDPFLRFWFRYVAPRRSALETGLTAAAARQVAAELPQFVGPIFEELCTAWLAERAAAGELPLALERVGRWWDRGRELDIVAIGGTTVCVGECKWTSRPVGSNVLENLQHNASDLIEHIGARRVMYAIFARAGFTDAIRAAAAGRDDILLVEADELLA
jgi:AAA+ ATPase superfamily predicted ATPase